MSAIEKRRHRGVNFTHDETVVLIELVLDHKTIIESKQPDSATWKAKEQAWEKIETIFNSKSNCNTRSAKALKIKYEGVKSGLKRKMYEMKKEYMVGKECKKIEWKDYECKLMPALNFSSRHESKSLESSSRSRSASPVFNLVKHDESRDALENIEADSPLQIGQPSTSSHSNTDINYPKDDSSIKIESCDEDTNDEHNWQENNITTENHSYNIMNDSENIQIPDTSTKFKSFGKDDFEFICLQKMALLREETMKNKEAEMKLKVLHMQMENIKSENRRKQEEHDKKIQMLANEDRRKEEEHKLKMKGLKQNLGLM